MERLVILSIALYVLHKADCTEIIWDKLASFDDIVLDDVRTDILHIPNRAFIYPGTKWCGPGDIADNDNDLGAESGTDMCCRTHDKCSDVIGGFQTEHNLTNPAFYTRVHCDCDTVFYDCLKNASTGTSNSVGFIYFNMLGTQCFKEEYPISGCNKNSIHLVPKCLDYKLDESKPKVYQWIDEPNY
ncbi:hypothetical protein JTB14_001741 [Gonioctena quinquepunctata]|nr:hypothetical protein JTB14_001741 [Gonioctena quinquepunctata]